MHNQAQPIVSTLLQQEPDLADLVDKFISHLPGLIDELNRLHAAGEWPRFAHKVHDLKGMGGNFGYQILTELAERMEQAIEHDERDALAAMLGELGTLHEGIRLGRAQQDRVPG